MRDVTLRFIDALRTAGLRISVSESMDALQAIGAVGVERDLLREALAASLVKEEDDRPIFEATFTHFFAAPGTRRKGKFREQSSTGEGQKTKATGQTHTPERPPEQQRPREPSTHWKQPAQPSSQQQEQKRATSIPNEFDNREQRWGSETLIPGPQSPAPHFLASRKTLLEKPFKLFDSRDVEAAKELVEDLTRRLHGHLSRRYKRSKHGRLDVRRTIRASISRGGVPIELLWRGRRPGKLDLIALCDLSGSVAVVSDFLLSLLAPAAEYFRRVRTFAYVDRLCEVSFEHGYVVPHTELDLYASSDFGKVLQQLWQEQEGILTRNTLVLILGDARNNRRPPRPDLLARIHNQVKKLVWLNPEPRERWNTGDSVIALYTPVCDLVLGCGNLRELLTALKRSL